METSELLKKVRKIELKTRGLSNHIFAGEYHTAFKGRGMAFSEVREYQAGDDIRTIDWNVTARFNNPFVKIFEEEREMTVILMIDVSGSKNFGTQNQMKQELVTELSAVLAFSAIQNNDKIGVIFFSDKVEKFIPPKKGKSHILRIIRELIAFEPQNKGTDIGEALRYFNNVIKKRSVCFVISDFIAEGFDAPLKIANKKHDVVSIRIHDPREEELPNVGIIQMIDAETNQIKWIDTSNKNVRDSYHKNYINTEKTINQLFKSSGVDTIQLRTDKDYIKPLIHFFKRRGK
ncbi:DUF58 domain-containing protein [Flavobacteriales bacterium]|jgi:uncharacterized protein (DUF58 family)|nr:DUF58 domain-containing protein [Flavobacteriales bacterium]